MADETVLSLSGIGVPPYSARGLTQSLEPIAEAGHLLRTINGTLVDLSVASFQKYKSAIVGSDQRPPACDGLWPGKVVIVDCIATLAYPYAGTPQRDEVSGSSFEEEGWVYYRPRLSMMVRSFQLSVDEWNAVTGWTMDLEEI